MKIKALSLALVTAALPVFAGEMGPQETAMATTYLMISGGYFAGEYQSNYTRYETGVLITQQSFDDNYSNGYGQIGIGTGSQIGTFLFDHQVSVSKLWGTESFSPPSTLFKYNQKVDFGYDLMPKMKLFQSLDAFGILGAHYARFHYTKDAYTADTTAFNNDKDQLGFNLGVGLNYRATTNCAIGLKYQHWQYQATQVNGADSTETAIDIQNITPVFNLVGVELRYYWS